MIVCVGFCEVVGFEYYVFEFIVDDCCVEECWW